MGPMTRRTGALVESVAHRPAWGKTHDPFTEKRPDRTWKVGRCRGPGQEWAKTIKVCSGVDIRVSVVATGTLGRLC